MCSPEQGADCFLRSAMLSRLFFILSPSRLVCGKEVLKALRLRKKQVHL